MIVSQFFAKHHSTLNEPIHEALPKRFVNSAGNLHSLRVYQCALYGYLINAWHYNIKLLHRSTNGIAPVDHQHGSADHARRVTE